MIANHPHLDCAAPAHGGAIPSEGAATEPEHGAVAPGGGATASDGAAAAPGGRADSSDGAAAAPFHHYVQFYETETFLLHAAGEFLVGGIRRDEPVVIFATEAHRRGLVSRLEAAAIDVARAVEAGRLVLLDADETLATVMSGELPDRERFHATIGRVIDAARARSRGARVRVYGEMVDVLWRAGRRSAALRIEELWNELARSHAFSLLCAYASQAGHGDHGPPEVCALHSDVFVAEPTFGYKAHDVDALVAEVARRTALDRELQTSLHELRAAEQAARRSKDDLADFLENAPVAIHSLDAAGTIVWANRAELELLGYPTDEYIGQPMVKFHVDPAVLKDMAARLSHGETLNEYEARLRARDGSILHVLVSSNMLVRNGKRIATRCFTRDITDKKRAEQERDRVIADLTRTVRLNDMFASIVGHDLRGPLSTIVMAGQLLLGYVAEPKAVRAVERVLNSADRMQRMISQLLDFARARADGGIELERRPTEVAEIARDVIEEVRFARPEWKIELDVHGDVRGEFDGNRLSQVFSNLIGNAVQHGSPDTPLAVRIDGRDPATIHVEVCNRGTIAPDLLPVLFAPFRGSHQKGLSSQGLGLGLFITDHIVRAHGGEITAESVGGATAFRFHLPRRASGAAQIATFDAGAPGSSADQVPAGRDRGGQLARYSAGAHDAAGRRPAHDAAHPHEERFRMLVESVKDYAIFMLDPRGNVTTWNAGAQRIKGYTADEIIGRHFSVFYPESDLRAGKAERVLQAALRDGRSEDEGWRLRKDGSRFWADVVITALRDPSGALVGYAKVTRDLTERRKIEEERIRLAHAQEAVRLRDEFLSLASHELKTPLTVLHLQLEALREQISSDDRATLSKLERSNRASQRLAELVEALLDVSRIATGRFTLNLEQGDIADIVATAVDRLHEAATVAGCTLSITADPAIGTWDRSRLDQVVTNLVSNAIRYAAGSPIAVTVTRQAGDVVIEVRDRGPGVPDGELARLFERFQRGASMRHFGGLGLGLYVVRQITEAHGGNVTAANLSGGGACFTVRLPLGSTPRDLVA